MDKKNEKKDDKQGYDPKVREPEIQAFWEKENVYKFDEASKKKVYSIDTPPPTVSGKMHLGHAFSYSQADFIARYKRMRGHNVFYPFGFDDNGLATERFVEKKENVRATKMPRKEFVKLCLKSTTEAEKSLKDSWARLGISCDWGISYRTIDDESQRTSQLSFVKLYKMGREYQKEAPTIWCPKCQTAIAQVELEDQELDSTFNDIRFRMDDGTDLVIATTRPELLPSCVAVFVHPEDKRYKKYAGKDATIPIFGQKVKILADERADPEKGTGAVMCCTFGDQTDIEWYKAHNLPMKISITKDGFMNENALTYKGMTIKDARKKIVEDLKKEGALVSQKPIKHAVNVHERCGTEIEILNTKQWFIRYLDLKDDFIKAGRKIKWYPEYMRIRYDNWINGLQWDWCISRQRYFGVPFPVWYCRKCGEIIVAEESELPVDPLEDIPKKACKCGSREFDGERDVLDTWATSSLTPEIALRWQKDKKFFKKMYPMDLRPQAHDIITFWLFNTVVKGLLHENEIPWKNTMISGHALDPHGKKMSKSKGNAIDPIETIKNNSADALRFWAAGSKLGDDLAFQEKDFITGRKFIVKLFNASRFAMIHLEGYKKLKSKPKDITTIDRWALSKLHQLIRISTDEFERHEYTRSKAETEKFFFQILCDNYLEIAKDRLYNQEKYEKSEVESAKYTLYEMLLSVLKLVAPIMPHITEEIYQSHFRDKEGDVSIHVSSWPVYDELMVDEKALDAGDLAVKAISAIRQYKSERKMPLNAPLDSVMIDAGEEIRAAEKDIMSTMKIGKIRFSKVDASDITVDDVRIKV
ncbi:MAG: valine--tRNA ligase [archaeon]